MSPKAEKTDNSRRFFVKAGLAGLGLSLLASAGATLDFLFPKVLYEPSQLLRLKRLDEYPDQEVIFDDENRLFIFRRPEGISVLTAICTHLGCTVNHEEGAANFRCPCHGSIFNKDGSVASGPAPKPLTWFYADLAKDGRLQVHTDRVVPPDFHLKVDA